MNVLDILDIFDIQHPEPSWRPWRAFVAAVYGEPLDDVALETFRRHTGRSEPRPGGYPEAVAISGVQSGKTAVAASLAVHAALTGERGTHALMLAQDQRGAIRALLRFARAPFRDLPAFQHEVARETADTIELLSGTSLSAYPCRPASIRGLRASIVCIDELAFFTATDGRPTDTEMLRAARGRVATTNGRLIVLSSPYGASGALYELHRRHYGRDDSDTLVWQASAPAMNPMLSRDYITRMEVEDPEAFRSEVLGEFRSGISNLLDPGALQAVIDTGVRERAPSDGTNYCGYVDAASGSGKDSFAIAISHRDGERVVLDCIRRWQPPFNPSGTISEASDLFRRYRIHQVRGDKYAPGFVSEIFRQNHITYLASNLTTSETYLELVPLINSGACLLLDDHQLVRELRGLERRRGLTGRDRVDHRPNQHDDLACAAAGAVVAASRRSNQHQLVGAGCRVFDASGCIGGASLFGGAVPSQNRRSVPLSESGRMVE